MKLPWEAHPDLSQDRLEFLGMLINSVREEALQSHEPEHGDTAWGLGCRVHERTCFAIQKASTGDNATWLSIIEGGLHFVFSVGGVPVRFYRGDSDRPPTRSLQRNFPEILAQQLSLSLGDGRSAGDTAYFWRLAIETDESGRVFRIVMVEVSGSGAIRSKWEVPYQAPIRAVGPAAAPRQEGRELPPPAVSLKSKEAKKKASDDGDQ